MKQTLITRKITALFVACTALLVLAYVPGNAEEDKRPAPRMDHFVGSYTVLDDFASEQKHKGAKINITRTGVSANPYGLFFQVRGGDSFQCRNAAFSGQDMSVSCAKKIRKRNIDLVEILTIGRLGGAYCERLRHDDDEKVSKSISEKCPSQNPQCACFRVEWFCLDETRDNFARCNVEAVAVITDPGDEGDEGDEDILFPPSQGSGTGGRP